MSKKTYWKDIRKSIVSSKGRFLSIMLLMMLGAFAFIALKVTGPDMQRTTSIYLKKHNTTDLSVIASYGFSDDEENPRGFSTFALQAMVLVMMTKKI